MPSPRRSVLVAVLVLVAGLGIAGCGRAQPGVAFYIGDTRYTEKQIDEMVDEARSAAPDASVAELRANAVDALVLRDLGRRAAEERSVAVPEPDYAGTARRLRLPQTAGLTRVIAESSAVANALIKVANPAQVTDRDLRDIYEVYEASGQQVPPYEQVAQTLRANVFLPRVLGTRDILVDQAKKVGVEVNPRYLPLTTSLGEVAVPLTDGIGPVVDER